MVRNAIKVVNFDTQILKALILGFLAHLVQNSQFLFNGVAFRDELIQLDISIVIVIDKTQPGLSIFLRQRINTFSLAVNISDLIALEAGYSGYEMNQLFTRRFIVAPYCSG